MILFLAITCSICFACKEVADDYAAVDGQPSIAYGNLVLPDGTNYVYPTQALVGDTLTIVGRLNIDKGATICLGSITVKPVEHQTFIKTNNNQNYTLDLIRFVVPTDVSYGMQQLKVTCNQLFQIAPAINIVERRVPLSGTDTTLIVTEAYDLAATTYASDFLTLSSSLRDASVTYDGVLCLTTSKKVFEFSENKVQMLYSAGETLQLQDGILETGKNTILINSILSATLSPDNLTLWLSIEEKLGYLSSYSYRYYLLKQDRASGTYTLINSTKIVRSTSLPEPSERYSGKVSECCVKAEKLKTDTKGNVMATNTLVAYGNSVTYRINSNTGLISALFDSKGQYASKGSLIGYNPDGTKALTGTLIPNSTGINYTGDLTIFNLQTSQETGRIILGETLPVISYDKNESYAFVSKLAYISGEQKMLLLANNNILLGGYGTSGRSLAAVEVLNKTLYCYAGTERGYTDYVAEQIQRVGKAKWVNFGNSKSTFNFLGVDKYSTIYYLYDITGRKPILYKLGRREDITK